VAITRLNTGMKKRCRIGFRHAESPQTSGMLTAPTTNNIEGI
jgi:hypothetical protein